MAQWSLNIWWPHICEYISDLFHYFFKLSMAQIEFDFIHKPDVPVFPLSGNGITIFVVGYLKWSFVAYLLLNKEVFVEHLPGARSRSGH